MWDKIEYFDRAGLISVGPAIDCSTAIPMNGLPMAGACGATHPGRKTFLRILFSPRGFV
jgi:hypothetical protein